MWPFASSFFLRTAIFSRFIPIVAWVPSPHLDESAAFAMTDLCSLFFWFLGRPVSRILFATLAASVGLDASSLLPSPLTAGEPGLRHQTSLYSCPRGRHPISRVYILPVPSTPELVSLARTFSLNSRARSSSLLGCLMFVAKTCPKSSSFPICSSHRFSFYILRPITL